MKIYISYLTVSLKQKYRHALSESFVSISHSAAMLTAYPRILRV